MEGSGEVADLSRVLVADEIGRVRNQGWSGVLALSQGEVSKGLFFLDGAIVFAASTVEEDRLGRLPVPRRTHLREPVPRRDARGRVLGLPARPRAGRVEGAEPPRARRRARGPGRADRALRASLDERLAAARADGPSAARRPGPRPQHQPAAAARDAPVPRRGAAGAGPRRSRDGGCAACHAGALRLRAGGRVAGRARGARSLCAQRRALRPPGAAAPAAADAARRARAALGGADRRSARRRGPPRRRPRPSPRRRG